MPSPPDGLILVTEAQAQELCGLTRSKWKSWVTGGLIEEDAGGAYDEGQVLEVALVDGLRAHLSAEDTRKAWRALKGSGTGEVLIERARMLAEDGRFDLVVELVSRIVRLADDDASLIAAVRHPEDPRAVLVVSLAARMRRVRDGFRVLAERRERPQSRKVGRPAKAPADVLPLRRSAPR